MGQIAERPYHEGYEDITKQKFKNGNKADLNDCAVVSICAATGMEYQEVYAQFAAMGRKTNGGSPDWMIKKILEQNGFRMKRVYIEEVIAKLPGRHSKALKNLTTYHPTRFPEVFKDGKTYLIYCRSHACVMVDGQVLDWSSNCKLRINSMFEILKG